MALEAGPGCEGNCVETAADQDRVLIRDSTNIRGAVLAIPAAAWRRFTRQFATDGL